MIPLLELERPRFDFRKMGDQLGHFFPLTCSEDCDVLQQVRVRELAGGIEKCMTHETF